MTAPTLLQGDCFEVLQTLEPGSVDSCVCDPPYSLGFMGRAWDKREDYDAAFGYWLAGFIDGEGCFRIQKHKRGTATCAFQIKVRDDDEAILKKCQAFLGAGTISREPGSDNQKPQIKWVVQDKAGCLELAALLVRFPLRAKKLRDFIHWAEAVQEWNDMKRGNRWSGQGDYSRLLALKSSIENARAYRSTAWSGNGFQDWCREWAEAVYRVLKPGGHLLAFGGTRTYHRLACGIEDAGFQIRNQIQWVFASGFPKSLNIEKALGDNPRASEWKGFGTDLKPAHEPIVVARKPLDGTVANNVLTHGVGGINVDGCRVGTTVETWPKSRSYMKDGGYDFDPGEDGATVTQETGAAPPGRWPANVIHDGSDEVLAEFAKYGESSGAYRGPSARPRNNGLGLGSTDSRDGMSGAPDNYGDTGTAARFFYSSKAGRDDRWSLLTCDCETVKPETWVSRDRSQSALTDVTSQPRDTFEADSMDECSYSMFTDGSEQTDLSRLGTASTTGTKTSSTTGSETFSSAPTPNTSESTPDVNSEMEFGGSRAADAKSSNPSTNPNGTFQKKAGRSTGVAASATYARSLRTKNCAVCGAARIEGHPTQKPTSLMRYLVRLVTPKGGLVLDPFAGSGTTLIAAYREDCRAIGIELDPDYFKMAQHRIDRATAQLRLDL